jgi:hypothetical protein
MLAQRQRAQLVRHSFLSLTPYSLTMPLLGWFLPYPTSPSRVVNKVGFERFSPHPVAHAIICTVTTH